MIIKRPTTLEVADVLRSERLFNHPLYDIRVSKWTNIELKQWRNIILGISEEFTKVLKNTRGGTNAVKILRVRDGKIYKSISECRDDTGLNRVAIYHLLEKNIHFQKICEN
jgi:hypothetical protein